MAFGGLPEWLIPVAQSIFNFTGQQEARGLNQGALANVTGLNEGTYNRIMGFAPSYGGGPGPGDLLGDKWNGPGGGGQGGWGGSGRGPVYDWLNGGGQGGTGATSTPSGAQSPYDTLPDLVSARNRSYGQIGRRGVAETNNLIQKLQNQYGSSIDQIGAKEQAGIDSLSSRYGQLFGDIGSGYDRLASQTGRGFGGVSDTARADYGGVLSRAGADYGSAIGSSVAEGGQLREDLRSGYQSRLDRNMDRINRVGGQQRADLSERYDHLNKTNQQALAQRGFGGSTVGSTLRAGNQREHESDRRRLEDQLLREKTEYDSRLSGDLLRATGAVGLSNVERNAALRTQRAGAMQVGGENMSRLLASLGLSGETAKLGVGTSKLGASERGALSQLGGITGLTGQGLSQLAQMLGQSAASRQQMGQFGIGARGEFRRGTADTAYGGGRDIHGLDMALTGNIARPFENANYPYPQGGVMDPIMQAWMLGQQPQPESGGFDLGGVLSGAGTAAAGAATVAESWPAIVAMFGAASDRNAKTDIREVDESEVLDALSEMPVSKWRYKHNAEPRGEHVGPMSQDFKAAFNLGDSDKRINYIDGIGIAMVAIKALRKEVERLNKLVSEIS